MEQTCARCGNKVKIYPGSINACGDFANCPWGGITPLVDTQTPRSTPLKLVIHKLDNGGYLVSDSLNEYGLTKPAHACTHLGAAFDYIARKMVPAAVQAAAADPVYVPPDTVLTIPISNATRANASAELAARDNRLDAAARSIADASLLLDAALNTLKPSRIDY